MGPLAGLAAALHYARDEGYDAVLTCGVDAVVLPEDLLEVLSPAPACLSAQPVIGLWPASAAPVLEQLLHSDERHSMFRFAELLDARKVEPAASVPNLHPPVALAALSG